MERIQGSHPNILECQAFSRSIPKIWASFHLKCPCLETGLSGTLGT